MWGEKKYGAGFEAMNNIGAQESDVIVNGKRDSESATQKTAERTGETHQHIGAGRASHGRAEEKWNMQGDTAKTKTSPKIALVILTFLLGLVLSIAAPVLVFIFTGANRKIGKSLFFSVYMIAACAGAAVSFLLRFVII